MAIGLVLFLAFVAIIVQDPLRVLLIISAAVVLASTIISLLVSLYIYDLSGLYKFKWIDSLPTDQLILNIHAGFDETSALLQSRFKSAELVAMDFYDSDKHTEVSIKRARAAYPPYPNTKHAKTNALNLPNESVDKIFVLLAAHEIRDEAERVLFFKELARILKPAGLIYVTEHLRDIPNFLAFNLGFFHFYSKSAWLRTFRQANICLQQEIKLTPFLSTFTLHKNGTAP